MNQIAQPEKHQVQHRIHRSRGDPGVLAIREWILLEQADANRRWVNLAGEELTKKQGEAVMLAKLLKTIDEIPLIKEQGAK